MTNPEFFFEVPSIRRRTFVARTLADFRLNTAVADTKTTVHVWSVRTVPFDSYFPRFHGSPCSTSVIGVLIDDCFPARSHFADSRSLCVKIWRLYSPTVLPWPLYQLSFIWHFASAEYHLGCLLLRHHAAEVVFPNPHASNNEFRLLGRVASDFRLLAIVGISSLGGICRLT